MANIDNTILTSDNAKQFDEITKGITFKGERNIERRPGQIFIQTSQGVPFQDIQKLSNENIDIIFSAKYSFESELWGTVYHVKYRAGEDKVVDAEPNYMWPVKDWHEKEVPCYNELIDKIKRIFEQVDIVVDDREIQEEMQEFFLISHYVGGKKIEWFEGELTIVVEHDGYKMSATKMGSQVDDIKCFKAKEIKTVEWEEISDSDSPF